MIRIIAEKCRETPINFKIVIMPAWQNNFANSKQGILRFLAIIN
jgi:hypothetical protein